MYAWVGVLCLALLYAAPGHAESVRYLDRLIEREGVSLHIQLEALDSGAPAVPQAGQSVRLKLAGRRLADGQPLRAWTLGAWLDREVDALSGSVPVCGQRIGRFLRGNVLDQPLVDLTGYYLLSLDAEPSVSVLDPAVNFSGRSSLYAAMKLAGKGFDWAKTDDDARLFVAVPDARAVAIADLQTLTVLAHVPVSGRPTRVVLQPDERLLWVGQTGEAPSEQAVEAIDTVTGRSVAHLTVPSGHHEFAFSDDGRTVFVSNRQSRTLSVIDAGTLTLTRNIDLGYEPIGVIAVPRERVIWVSDPKAGRMHRYDWQGRARDSLALEPGLGPARLTPDGRFVLVLNPSQHRLTVLDAATGKERHRLTVSGQPYDIIFSTQYAYIRTLESEQVGMLALASLTSSQPTLQFIPAGAQAVSASPGLPRASSMTPTMDLAGAFFVTPAERTVYHYMEGMNAPDTGLRAFGHTPVAALVMRRGLREVSPGEYAAVLRLPSAGRMVLALGSETPALRECLGLKVEAPVRTSGEGAVTVEWLQDRVTTTVVGRPVEFRLRIKEGREGRIPDGVMLRLRVMPARGGQAVIWPLTASEDHPGEWAGAGVFTEAGGYYIHVEGPVPVSGVYTTVVVTNE